MKGKLIIIEGGDGSGKATQTKRLYNRLKDEDKNIRKIEFPDYESDSSALIKMYLKGDFGKKAEDVNSYVASTFYAVDRYASYKTKWKDFYESGGIVVADRYTTSNMVHQASKISDYKKWEEYLNWLCDFEFKMFELPEPDLVIFLDVDPEKSKDLMASRKNKFTGEMKKDIHESDLNHLKDSHKNALKICEKYGWKRIECIDENGLKSIEEIHEQIYEIVSKLI